VRRRAVAEDPATPTLDGGMPPSAAAEPRAPASAPTVVASSSQGAPDSGVAATNAAVLIPFEVLLTGADVSRPVEPTDAPAVTMGAVVVDGSGDSRNTLRFLVDAMPKLNACYADGVRRNARLSGRVAVVLHVDASGAVSRVERLGSSVDDASVVSCVSSLLERFRYPSTASAGRVAFALSFSPGKAPVGAKNGPRRGGPTAEVP
jgi:hypothetical protein